MVSYHTLRIPAAGADDALCRAGLHLIGRIFGAEEEALEALQLSGDEAACNDDTFFVAEEDGIILGTIHLTVPKLCPSAGMLGGLCTAPEARGRGIGKKLFSLGVEAHGGDTLFLGTSNPSAARMYMGFGFSFLPGTNIMIRRRGGTAYDFFFEMLADKTCRTQRGDASLRVPLVPLTAWRGDSLSLDCNTGLLSSAVFTQLSCSGLYPRYVRLAAAGGTFDGAVNGSGALCALASSLPAEGGVRIDGFAWPGFDEQLTGLLDSLSRDGAFAVLAKDDAGKQAVFSALGYQPARPASIPAPCGTIAGDVWTK